MDAESASPSDTACPESSFSMSPTDVSRPRCKLPARYAGIVMPFILSIVMTFIVSGISTLKALGPSMTALQTWPASWALSWLVAFPTLLVVLPLVRRLVALVVATPSQG
jgi:hypothetical protein